MTAAEKVVSALLEAEPGSFDSRAYFLEIPFEARVKEAERLFARSKSAVNRLLPTMSSEQAQNIRASTAKLDQLYAERRHKLAQIQYALNYRRALRKAGVTPEEVAQQFTRRDSFGKVSMTEVELKDGRRVRLDSFEIPRELLK